MSTPVPYTRFFILNHKVVDANDKPINPPYYVYVKKGDTHIKIKKDITFFKRLISNPIYNARTFFHKWSVVTHNGVDYWKQPVNGQTCPESNMTGFRVIPDYSLYAVDTEGTIQNRRTGRKLKNSANTGGYRKLLLRRDGHSEFDTVKVHRAVMLSHTDWKPKHIDMDVDHVHKDRTDNRLSQLEWVTAQENTKRRDQP